MEVVDFLGKTLAAGQHVVYPGRRSSSLWMNQGIVKEVGTATNFRNEEYGFIKVEREGSEVGYIDPETKQHTTRKGPNVIVKITELKRVVIVE